MTRTTTAIISALLLATALSGCGLTGPVPAQEFSATMEITNHGVSMTGTLYAAKDKERYEIYSPEPTSVIMRFDKGVIWVLVPSYGAYIEMGGSQLTGVLKFFRMTSVRRGEKLGKETVDGHPTVKERLKMDVAGRALDVHQWFATDIGWPVRVEALDGSYVYRLRNIQVTPQSPTMFELPEGYRDMADIIRQNEGRTR